MFNLIEKYSRTIFKVEFFCGLDFKIRSDFDVNFQNKAQKFVKN